MVKSIIAVLSALVDLCLSRMREIELSGNNDCDGVPLNPDYNTLGFCVASFRDVVKELNTIKEDNEDE